MKEGESYKFLGKPYAKNNLLNWQRLKVGDKAIVHPVKGRSISKAPYEVEIIESVVNWESGERKEICTNIEGQHSAVINDYLFSRLEFKK